MTFPARRPPSGDLGGYSPEWYSAFGEPPAEITLRQVEFIDRQRGPGNHVLDACCGLGRHSVALARRGFAVTGIDSAPLAIESAQRRSAGTSGVQFVCCSIEDFCARTNHRFGTVMCLWQSLGLGTRDETVDQLALLTGVLDPGGRLIIDIYNRAWWASHSARHRHRVGGADVDIDSELVGDRLSVRNTFHLAEGDRISQFNWVVFGPDEFVELARGVGLSHVLTCSEYDESAMPGTNSSMQLVLSRTHVS